jgi:hypothetical protein
METTNVVETIDGPAGSDLRVVIVKSENAEVPYNSGACPIIEWPTGGRAPWRRTGPFQVTGISSYTIPDAILSGAHRLARRYDRDEAVGRFARWLRIYHGGTDVRTYQWSSSAPLYVAFDTEEWRTSVGYTASEPLPSTYRVDMPEWRAYCEGEVYGYIVQRRDIEPITVALLNEAAGLLRRDATYAEVRACARDLRIAREEYAWHDSADACYGYYGYRWAAEAATEALALAVRDEAAGSRATPGPDSTQLDGGLIVTETATARAEMARRVTRLYEAVRDVAAYWEDSGLPPDFSTPETGYPFATSMDETVCAVQEWAEQLREDVQQAADARAAAEPEPTPAAQRRAEDAARDRVIETSRAQGLLDPHWYRM